jgi:hypothetical protein
MGFGIQIAKHSSRISAAHLLTHRLDWPATGDAEATKESAMYARYSRVIVLALILLFLVQDRGPRPQVRGQDENIRSHAEPASDQSLTTTSHFRGEEPESDADTGASGIDILQFPPTGSAYEISAGIAPSSESRGLLEAPRFGFALEQPSEAKIDGTSQRFFDTASYGYISKHVIAVPLSEESHAVTLKMQANETPLPGSSGAFPVFTNNDLIDTGVIDNGVVGVETKWLESGKERLEIALGYHYNLSRPHAAGASLKYSLPEFLAPIHVYAKPEVRMSADGSNQEKFSLAAWSDLPARWTPAPRWTATVGIQRQDALSRRYFHESYRLDWGAALNLTERVSAGLNVSYSLEDRGLGAILYMELKAPARVLRGSLGGAYEPGMP